MTIRSSAGDAAHVGSRIETAAAALLGLLAARGLRVATAESLTGGMICAALTAIPGASACVAGGVVTYTDAVKHALLGVPDDLLLDQGAVSAEVARAMAQGVMARMGVDLAISATGYAGPDGDAGLVWLGLATATGVVAHGQRFTGDRAEIRQSTVLTALSLLTRAAENLPAT